MLQTEKEMSGDFFKEMNITRSKLGIQAAGKLNLQQWLPQKKEGEEPQKLTVNGKLQDRKGAESSLR